MPGTAGRRGSNAILSNSGYGVARMSFYAIATSRTATRAVGGVTRGELRPCISPWHTGVGEILGRMIPPIFTRNIKPAKGNRYFLDPLHLLPYDALQVHAYDYNYYYY